MELNINKFEITETIDMYDGLATLAVVKHYERNFIRYWTIENDNEIGYLLSEVDEETLQSFKDNELSLQGSMLKMGNHYQLTFPIEHKDEYKEVKNLDGKIESLPEYDGNDLPEQEFYLEDFC